MSVKEHGTLQSWLDAHRSERPDAIALRGTEGHVTYGELADDVDKLAAGLASLGISKGDVVAAQLPNGGEFVVAFLATAICGAIFQPIHMTYRTSELRYLLDQAKTKAVFAMAAGNKYSPVKEMLTLQQELPSLKHVVAVGDEVEGAIAFDAFFRGQTTPAAFVETGEDDPYLLLYTSGTTADPKGVPHVYRRLLGNAYRSAAELGLSPGSRVLSLAAFSHLYGLLTVQLALAAGAEIAFVPTFEPATVLDDFTRLQPSHIFAAPAHFAPLVANQQIKPAHLAKAEMVCLSGAMVPPPLAQAVDNLMENGVVIQLWGMSELQAGSFGRPHDPLEKRISTAGRASMHTQLRVTDEDGEPLAAGQEGALEVRGPSVFSGYLNNPTETERAFTRDGWFRTGDLARLDAQGYLNLTGRTKEIINRGGVKYNPVEPELIALTHPAIMQCAVVPIPDAVLGERACICVVTSPGATVTLEDVCALLEAKGIAKYKWPERLQVFPELPMTPTKKVMRGRLASMLRQSSKP